MTLSGFKAMAQTCGGGYFNYHAVPGNLIRLGDFRSAVCRLWRQALKRRSQPNRLQWSRYGRLADLYIPRPRNAHPYPEDRFASHTRGRSAYCSFAAQCRSRAK